MLSMFNLAWHKAIILGHTLKTELTGKSMMIHANPEIMSFRIQRKRYYLLEREESATRVS